MRHIAGNGGYVSDSEHIVGVLMKRLKIPCMVTPEMAEKVKAINPIRWKNFVVARTLGIKTIGLQIRKGIPWYE